MTVSLFHYDLPIVLPVSQQMQLPPVRPRPDPVKHGPGQSEVIMWSRDLVWTNHSSPRRPQHRVVHDLLVGAELAVDGPAAGDVQYSTVQYSTVQYLQVMSLQ